MLLERFLNQPLVASRQTTRQQQDMFNFLDLEQDQATLGWNENTGMISKVLLGTFGEGSLPNLECQHSLTLLGVAKSRAV